MIAATITVGAVTPVTLLIPGPQMNAGYIQNNGSVNLRISLDGVSLPTTTKGMVIYAGTQLWLPDYIKNAVLAIAESGTTAVDVGTDDLTSTAPGV